MDKYEKIFNDAANTFTIWQQKDEFIRFLKYLDTKIKPVNFMEIGICNGATFFSWASIVAEESGIKIGIDYPNGSFGTDTKKTYFQMNVLKQRLETYKPNTHIFYGDSREKHVIDWVDNKLKETKLDFLFIDGDHTYEGVKNDFYNYSKYVRKGGIIAFHDIVISDRHHSVNCYVDKLWNELKGEKIEFTTYGCDWGGIGVLKWEGNNEDSN